MMIASLSVLLGVFFSISVSSFDCSVFFVVYQLLWSFGIDFALRLAPDGVAIYVLRLMVSVCSLRFLWVGFYNLIDYIISFITYPRLLIFADLFLSNVTISLAFVQVAIILAANPIMMGMIMAAPISVAAPFFLIFGPILLLMNMGLIFTIIDLFALSLFGIPLNQTYHNVALRKIRTLSVNLSRQLVQTLLDEGLVKFISRHCFATAVMLGITMFRLPVEIVEMVLIARPRENYMLNSRHFYKRLAVGSTLFFQSLMPTFFLLNVCLLVFIFWCLVGCYILFALYGLPAFGILGALLVQTITVLFPKALVWWFEVSSDHMKAVYTYAVLLSAKFSSNLPVFLLKDDKSLIRVNERLNLKNLSKTELERLATRLCRNEGFGKVAFPLIILLFVFLFCLRVFFRGAIMIISAPINFIVACMWFLLAFLIPDFFFDLMDVGLAHATPIWLQMWPEINRYLRMLGISALYGVRYIELLHDEPMKGGMDLSELPKLNQLFVRTWVSMVRRSVLKTIERLDNIRLPEMIQAAYRPPSLDSIRSTYAFLQDIGFPVDQTFIDSLTRPEASSYLAEWGSWKNWLLGTSNFGLGFRDVKVGLRKWLPADFFPEIQGYVHTTSFTGIAEEIRSTARYWNGNHEIDMEEEALEATIEDTFHMVSPQYAYSRLSKFSEVYRLWVKRFNMGFGFGYIDKKTSRLRQLTRQQVIDYMGGKTKFLEAWGKIFKHSQTLLMPSPVFTKWESLKLKKALSRSVRTVVGSAFTHHVMTTVFNYKPNHNFHPWENPSKVGMPINGQNFNRLWLSMAKHSCIWAGDMTAFDSSQIPAMLKVCAEIRKKGYTYHRDYHKICEIIDISYDMLRDQPLAFKNFGDIAVKGQGATTGHSSTTPDNTIMLVANYMFAWRAITGLRAREMEKFVELANFGDDHIMSYDPVFGFTPEKCIEVMAKIGTVMRDEAPGQDYLPLPGRPLPHGVKDWRDCKFSFLSKMPLPIDAAIASELQAAGITDSLVFATCHDKQRLLGKIKGQVLNSKESDPIKSYASLIGYMYLTAHHHDVYQSLARDVVMYRNKALQACIKAKGNINSIEKAPSYNDVLRQWYSKKPFPFKDEERLVEDADIDQIYMYSSPDPFGIFVRWLSDLPTLLSPRYRNIRWADWIQGKLADQLSWPITFIGHANGCSTDLATCRSLLSRTPYSYLRAEVIVPREGDFGNLLVKHWVYVCMTRVVSYRRSFSPLDLIRLADSAFINLLYMGTGRLTQSVVELDLHIVDILIVYLCSFIKFNVYLPPVLFYIPAPSEWFARLLTYVIGLVSPGGSIDFQPLNAQLRRLAVNPQASFILAAPTGVGKSTRMINTIQNSLNRRVVVVVPRHLIAESVGKYMQNMYPDSGIGISTEGYTFKNDDRIIYCTAQSFFSNPLLRRPGDVVVLDEAHIQEPHYHVMRNYLDNPAISKIYMTATPPKGLRNVTKLEIPSTQTFSVQKGSFEVKAMSKYINDAIDFANERTPLEKILIFVPTVKQMDDLAYRIRHKVCRLSSKHRVIDESATVFVATSVADAGLTIPDVSFVLSMDIDVTVVQRVIKDSEVDPKTGQEPPVKPSDVVRWFRLSPQTIKQRLGRTGRTSNGVFLLYSYIGSDLPILDEVEYTTSDFINAMRPATCSAYPYFPEVNKDLSKDELKALYIYDLLPHPPSSLYRFRHNVQLVRSLVDEEMQEDMPDFDEDGEEDEEFIPKEENEIFDEKLGLYITALSDPEVVLSKKAKELVFNDWDIDPHDAWQCKQAPSVPKEAGFLPSAPKDWVDNREFYSRQNVSGSGLLCGSRIVVGLVYTHFGIRLSEQLITSQIVDLLPEGMRKPEYMSFFDWNQVRTILLHYGLRCTLIAEGIPTVDPLVFNDNPGFRDALAYLNDNHYNYLGLKIQGPEEDSRFVDLWKEGPF